MSMYSWKNTYLIHYSVNKDKSIETHYAAPIIHFDHDNDNFYGVKAPVKWGIKINPKATHYGIVDMTDESHPKWIVKSEMIEPSRVSIFKYKGHYVIFKRSLKNMKMHIHSAATTKYQEINA